MGTDMDGAPIKDFPEEMRHIAELRTLPDYLLGKGYSRGVVEKIMGTNFLRVIKTNLEKVPDDIE